MLNIAEGPVSRWVVCVSYPITLMRCSWEAATGFDIIVRRKNYHDCVYKTDFLVVHVVVVDSPIYCIHWKIILGIHVDLFGIDSGNEVTVYLSWSDIKSKKEC